MVRSAFALLAAALLAWPAAGLSAQEEVVGEWEMSIQTGRGSFTQTFAFTMEDGALKGTVTNQMGGTERVTDLSNVKFEDGTLTFDVTRTFRDNSFTQSYTATIDGDEMTGTITGGRGGRGGGGRGGPQEFTAIRKSG